MNEQDRQAIEGLFSRLADAEQKAGSRDAEAEAFIQQRIAKQPGAAYMMAQTIVMQNFALEQARQRIEELERERSQAPANAQSNGGLFGSSQPAECPRHTGTVPVVGQRPSAPQVQPSRAGGGGFLAGAAQTAIGVAGGIMLGNLLGSMFSGGDTAAAAPADAGVQPIEPTSVEPVAEPEPAADDSGGGFFDSIFGDGGDFDF